MGFAAAALRYLVAAAVVVAGLDRIQVDVETSIRSPSDGESSLEAGSFEANLERLAAAQRFRDDLVSGAAPSALGGYTVDVVFKSSEYEKRTDDDEGEEDDGEREATAGSADVELSERRARALPFRAVRQIKRSEAPLEAWRRLASDFPAFRGSLAGPAPKAKWNQSALDDWEPPTFEALWVAGVTMEIKEEDAYALVREALRAVDAHATRVAELEAVGVDAASLSDAPRAPRAIYGVERLDAAGAMVVYDSRLDEDADFDEGDAPADLRLFVDPSSKAELEVVLRVLDVYFDVDLKQSSIPVVVSVHPGDARCRAALRGLDGEAAKRKFLDALWKAPRGRGGLDDATILGAARAASKRASRPDLAEEDASFETTLADLGLAGLKTPFVVANGKIARLFDDDGVLGADEARRTAGMAGEQAFSRGAATPSSGAAPFYNPTLTPLVVEGAEEPKETVFSKAAKAAGPPRAGWTVYVGGDADDVGARWADYLVGVDASARVERSFVAEKVVAKKKGKRHKQDAALSPPFLVCNDVVTPLAAPVPPATADPAAVKRLARCARRLKAADERPHWEAQVRSAPAAFRVDARRRDARAEVLAVVDPLGPAAGVVATLVQVLAEDLYANVTVAFVPHVAGSDLRKWSRTSVYGEPVVFPNVRTAGRVRVELKTPTWWQLKVVSSAGGDLDNLEPASIDGDVAATFALRGVFLRGKSNGRIRAAVGANFFKPQQAEEKRCVAVGRGGEHSQVLEANGEFAVAVTDFNETVRLGTARRAVPSKSLAPKPLKYRKDWFGACNTSTHNDGKIHVFSVASGQTYERLLRIMIASVALASSRPVKVWLLEEFLSPAFDATTLEAAVGVEIELLESPPWPEFLTDAYDRNKVGIRGDKQRLIWAYKILFLDALFFGKTDRVIFVDADQIVLGDLAELWDMDLNGHPYAFTPFCHGADANPTTKGHRFWESGFWGSHLGEWYQYHISALFVVDVDAFAKVADTIRGTYKGMAPDPNSFANLDQDLPNYLQTSSVPIKPLPQEWLYCETWCAPHTKAAAKSIDMCQNPRTKEHKLDMARRIADPLWSKLDAYLADLPAQKSDFRTALAGASVTAPAAPVEGEL